MQTAVARWTTASEPDVAAKHKWSMHGRDLPDQEMLVDQAASSGVPFVEILFLEPQLDAGYFKCGVTRVERNTVTATSETVQAHRGSQPKQNKVRTTRGTPESLPRSHFRVFKLLGAIKKLRNG